VTCPADPAARVVDVFSAVMGELFGPGDCPPRGGACERVWFYAGDGAMPTVGECEPLVWVRVAHRFRSKLAGFPAAFVGSGQCQGADVVPVVAVEVGVSRCTSMEVEPDWATQREEALVSLDDSWRIDRALCLAQTRLKSNTRKFAADTVAPAGPMGGVIAWTGMAYVQLTPDPLPEPTL